ncbi:MAG: hypothetical protein FD143_3622 [Ignavibacteria bacterium]|nr:MAG: hypothetical protein FD143_3622 [Ignavibacteria bacterium]
MTLDGEYLSAMPPEDWECDDDEDGSPPSKKVASSNTNLYSLTESELKASIEEDSRKFNETFEKEVEDVKRCLAEERKTMDIASLKSKYESDTQKMFDEFLKQVQEIEAGPSSLST